MRRLRWIVTSLLACAALGCSDSPTKRLLYLSMPDGAQEEGRSEPGILIFDIDDGHKFVRRIDMPVFEEGLRGFAGNLSKHSVYYSSTNHRLGRFDLESEAKVWGKRLRCRLRPILRHAGRQEDLRTDRLVVLRRGQRLSGRGRRNRKPA